MSPDVTASQSTRSDVGLRSERGPILLAVMLCTALVALDATIIATAVPAIVTDLGGFSQFPWLFSIYLLAQAVSVPIYGKLADSLGRKPVMLVGTGGTRQATYDKYGYGDALRTQIEVGIFNFCGMTDVETHLLLDVDGEPNAERRAGYLVDARALGAGLVAPDRVPNRVQHGAVRQAA